MPLDTSASDARLMKDLVQLVKGRFFGKYRGIVHSNTPDPTRRGRIQVRVPSVLNDQVTWAMPSVPYAGKDVGFHMLPNKDTGVWVEFEGGDPSFPIWTGCFWSEGDIATLDNPESVKFIRTKRAAIRIDDGNGKIEITTGAQTKVTISPDKIELEARQVDAGAGPRKTSLTYLSFNVNNGALEVT